MRSLAKVCAPVALLATAIVIYLGAQTPPVPGAGGQAPAQPPRRVGGGAGAEDKHVVDAAAADRGKKNWAAGCITWHGNKGRGGERGAHLIPPAERFPNRRGCE